MEITSEELAVGVMMYEKVSDGLRGDEDGDEGGDEGSDEDEGDCDGNGIDVVVEVAAVEKEAAA